MSFRIRPANLHPSLRNYGRPSPEKQQGEGREGNAAATRDPTSSGARRAPGGDLSCAGAGRRQGPSAPGNMAAPIAVPIAAPGRALALLRAGAERLLPGGVGALLRPRLEGGSPGPERDFSLSHSRVRARSSTPPGPFTPEPRCWGRVETWRALLEGRAAGGSGAPSVGTRSAPLSRPPGHGHRGALVEGAAGRGGPQAAPAPAAPRLQAGGGHEAPAQRPPGAHPHAVGGG